MFSLCIISFINYQVWEVCRQRTPIMNNWILSIAETNGKTRNNSFHAQYDYIFMQSIFVDLSKEVMTQNGFCVLRLL
jgi:hypothetical protein